MRKKYFLSISLYFMAAFQAYAQLTVTNDGLGLTLQSGLTATIEGGYTNKTNATTLTKGTINNAGVITLIGDWTNNSANVVFSPATTGTVKLIGTAAQTISGTNPTAFNNLTINNTFPTTAITMDADVTVNGIFTLTDGHILTTPLAGGLLTLGDDATVTLGATPQDSSFVKGKMAYIEDDAVAATKVFPIGKDNDYRRVDLYIAQNVAAATTYTTEMINASAVALGYTPVGFNWVSGVRYYEITQSVPTVLDNAYLDVFFQCTQKDDVVEDESDLIIAQDDGAGKWNSRGNFAISSIIDPSCGGVSRSGDIYSNPFTVFHAGANQFSLGSILGTNPLPLELLSFDAIPNGNAVDVMWITASEFNMDYFVVQRSIDFQGLQNLEGAGWEDVAQVKAAGNSSITKKYSSVDYDPYKGISYYRLKQVDNNGKIVFSNVVSVNFHSDDVMSVFPNPSAQGAPFNVRISDKKGKYVLVVVRDVQGREFYSKAVVIASDKEVFAIDSAGKLASGVYCVIAAFNYDIYEKIIVIK